MRGKGRKIISEPNVPENPDKKRVVLNSIIFTIIFAFIYFGANIALRLNKELLSINSHNKI